MDTIRREKSVRRRQFITPDWSSANTIITWFEPLLNVVPGTTRDFLTFPRRVRDFVETNTIPVSQTYLERKWRYHSMTKDGTSWEVCKHS